MEERVALVGCGGAGKTVLAHRLARLLGCGTSDLDAPRYRPDWSARSAAEFVAAQQVVVAADRWVIDGNYYPAGSFGTDEPESPPKAGSYKGMTTLARTVPAIR